MHTNTVKSVREYSPCGNNSSSTRTNKLLEELASYRGNRSLVIREAIQVYADMEDRLDKIEADPAFQAMMKESDKAIREDRVTSNEEVLRMSRARSKRKQSGPRGTDLLGRSCTRFVPGVVRR